MLLASCRQPADDVTLESYAVALAMRWEIEEWDAFVVDALRSGRYPGGHFPAAAELGADVDAWRVGVERVATKPKLALPPPALDPVEFSRRLREVMGDDAATMPAWPNDQAAREPVRVKVTDARLAELKDQAEKILEDGAQAS